MLLLRCQGHDDSFLVSLRLVPGKCWTPLVRMVRQMLGWELLHWQILATDFNHFQLVLLRSLNLRNCVGSGTEAFQNGESGKSRCLENALCVGDKQSSSLCHTANCHGVLCWILSHTRGCLWFSQHLRCDACRMAEDFTHEPITMTVNAYLKRKKYTWLTERT